MGYILQILVLNKVELKAETHQKLLLQGLARSDKKAVETIYKENFNMVQALIINNNGTAEDAKDMAEDVADEAGEKVEDMGNAAENATDGSSDENNTQD